MFALFSGLWKWLFETDSYRFLVLGIDNAGKTTTLEQLKLSHGLRFTPVEQVCPTIGLNFARIKLEGVEAFFWDLGGQVLLRKLWIKYFEECSGILFVCDCSDPERWEECRETLLGVLRHESFTNKDIPVMVFLNKVDMLDPDTKQSTLDYLQEAFFNIHNPSGHNPLAAPFPRSCSHSSEKSGTVTDDLVSSCSRQNDSEIRSDAPVPINKSLSGSFQHPFSEMALDSAYPNDRSLIRASSRDRAAVSSMTGSATITESCLQVSAIVVGSALANENVETVVSLLVTAAKSARKGDVVQLSRGRSAPPPQTNVAETKTSSRWMPRLARRRGSVGQKDGNKNTINNNDSVKTDDTSARVGSVVTRNASSSKFKWTSSNSSPSTEVTVRPFNPPWLVLSESPIQTSSPFVSNFIPIFGSQSTEKKSLDSNQL